MQDFFSFSTIFFFFFHLEIILHTILLEMSLFAGVVWTSSQCSFWCINLFDCGYYCLLIYNYIHPFGAQPHSLAQCGCFNKYFFYLDDIFFNTVTRLDAGTIHCPPASHETRCYIVKLLLFSIWLFLLCCRVYFLIGKHCQPWITFKTS